MRLELHETGQCQVDGHWVGAANIWAREQITVDEEPPVDLAQGEELEIAGARWRVVEIVEDPVHQRGDVILERAQD